MSVVIAFSKLWRSIVYSFTQLQCIIGSLFDLGTALGHRRAMAMELWGKPPGCIDDYDGWSVHHKLCAHPSDLWEEDLAQFMNCMFSRCVSTRTMVDMVFAHLSRETTVLRTGINHVALKHVTALFVQALQRWWGALPGTNNSSRCRPALEHKHPRGAHTCAWHMHARNNPPPGGSITAE